MTDNEIIKALECCQTQYDRNCKECPYQKYKSREISVITCSSELRKDLLDLINRLQAENERLREEIKKEQLYNLRMTAHSVKAEAYKECIEKINKYLSSRALFGSMAESIICESIISENDNLLKELVGEDNG